MRIKRFAAGLMACLMMCNLSLPALAAETVETEQETTSTITAETEAAVPEAEEYTEAEGKNAENVEAKNTKTGTVHVATYLNLRTGAGTENDIIGHLLDGTQVEVGREENGWYQVTVPEQNGYVCGDYLSVAEGETAQSADTELMAEMSRSAAASSGLTPDGNLTLVDDIGSSKEAGQQFITLVTKDGNTFYLVIDRDDDGNENVHFMNLVDEEDLFALLDEDSQETYQKEATEDNASTATEVTEEETQQTEIPEGPVQESEPKGNGWAAIMLLVIAAIGGGGVYFYLMVQKKKKEKAAAKPDPDADYEDDEDAYELPEESEDEDADEETLLDEADFEDETELDEDVDD